MMMITTFETLELDYLRQTAILDAWKEISRWFNWSETLLEKYQDKLDWNEVSDNREIQWTIPMLEKFKDRINWDVLSRNPDKYMLTEAFIETFRDKWNWSKLSDCYYLKITYELLDKFADKWDWAMIIDRYHHSPVYEGKGMDFYLKYKKYISAEKLKGSRLWDEIVEQQKQQLIGEITGLQNFST